MANLIKQMKENIAKSGSSKKEILYFGKDSIHRVRFLDELDEGHSFVFHSSFNDSIYELCEDPEDHESCKLCEASVPTIENFVWSVWDYDSSSVKLLVMKATGVSFIPALIEMFEEFGTIKDRDYKIKKIGSGQGSSFAVTPLDKEKFKNSKAKVMTEKEIKEIFKEAYKTSKKTDADTDDDNADEDEKPSKKGKKNKADKIRSQYEELSLKELKAIGKQLGYSKSELAEFEDEDELIEEFFDNYEIDDLEEMLEEEDE